MSWLDFLAMKGYAWYVWGSYGVAILTFLIEVILVRHRKKMIVRQLRRSLDDRPHV